MLLNRPRAEQLMREYRLDALVATSPIHVTYFTDYYSWLDRWFKDYMVSPGSSNQRPETFAVLPFHGDPTLIVNPIFAANALDLPLRNIQTFGDTGLDLTDSSSEHDQKSRQFLAGLHSGSILASAVEALIHTLRTGGYGNARIGVEMQWMRERSLDSLRAALPAAKLLDCSNLIRMIRMVKTAEEIRRLTRAAEINENAGTEALAASRPEMMIAEVVHHFQVLLARMGAEYDHFAYSPRGCGIAMETAHLLAQEDIQYVDFGCIFGHYFSDTGTTLAFRPLPRSMKLRYDALKQCIDAGVAAIRSGVLSSVVQSTMWSEFQRHGFKASFPHGHGIGLEPREYPILVPENRLRIKDDCVDIASDLPLEEAMVVNLEAGMFVPELGSLQIEKTVIVEQKGCRMISSQMGPSFAV